MLLQQLQQLSQMHLDQQLQMQQVMASLRHPGHMSAADSRESSAARTALDDAVGEAIDGMGLGLGELRREVDSAMELHGSELSALEQEVSAHCPVLHQLVHAGVRSFTATPAS
jgi:hypothetical protein